MENGRSKVGYYIYLIMKIAETKDFSYVTEAQYCNVTDTQYRSFFIAGCG
jgi:hypothetical protein